VEEEGISEPMHGDIAFSTNHLGIPVAHAIKPVTHGYKCDIAFSVIPWQYQPVAGKYDEGGGNRISHSPLCISRFWEGCPCTSCPWTSVQLCLWFCYRHIFFAFFCISAKQLPSLLACCHLFFCSSILFGKSCIIFINVCTSFARSFHYLPFPLASSSSFFFFFF